MFPTIYLHPQQPTQRSCRRPRTAFPTRTDRHPSLHPWTGYQHPYSYHPTVLAQCMANAGEADMTGHRRRRQCRPHKAVPRHGPWTSTYQPPWGWDRLPMSSESSSDEEYESDSNDEQGPTLEQFLDSFFHGGNRCTKSHGPQETKNKDGTEKFCPKLSEKGTEPKESKQRESGTGKKQDVMEGENKRSGGEGKCKQDSKMEADLLKTTVEDMLKMVFGAFTPKEQRDQQQKCRKGKACQGGKCTRTGRVGTEPQDNPRTAQDKPTKPSGEADTSTPCLDEKGPKWGKDAPTKPEKEYSKDDQTIPGVKVIKKLRLHGFDPDSIMVKILSAKGVIQVTAQYCAFTPFGPYRAEQTKIIPIPEGVNTRDIKSYLTEDNTLVIQAAITTEGASDGASTPTSGCDLPQSKEDPSSGHTQSQDSQDHNKQNTEQRSEPTGEDVAVEPQADPTTDVSATESNQSVLVPQEASSKQKIDSKKLQENEDELSGIVPISEKQEAVTQQDPESKRILDVPLVKQDGDFEIIPQKDSLEFQDVDPKEPFHSYTNEPSQTTSPGKAVESSQAGKQGSDDTAEKDEPSLSLEHTPAPPEDIATDAAERHEAELAQFTLSGFASDDIKLEVKDGFVEVSARREEETSKGLVQREYFRAVPLSTDAAGVDPASVRGWLDLDDFYHVVYSKQE